VASIPVKNKQVEPPGETVEQQFRRLAAEWEAATAYHSSTTLLNSHPAYRAVIALGPAVVPLLLRDMEKDHTH
jgi:hypothetical protein